ncbi:MAG: hypothetical protein JWR83_2329 [Aeromicrobium sp.]|nr:hypothetical protein [Aeromicrobium sp.]
MAIPEPPRPRSGAEPARPEPGLSGAERGPHASDLEREIASDKSLPKKILAAANPKLFFGIVKDYPAGIKQFLWLCLGILYIPWLIAVVIAWPVIVIAKGLGVVLFAIWWFCTGWFWKRLGGEKPSREKRKQMDADRKAKLEAIRAERYE